jgi:hypothetical protein
MNPHISSRYHLFLLITIIYSLLTACQPTVTTASSQPTQPPVQPSPTSKEVAPGISLDYSKVAQNVTVETVTAQPGTPGGPYWEAAPQYRLLTLEGYPVTSHLRKPQIIFYSVEDLPIANENMDKIATDLQALLQAKQTGVQLPFLPLFSESQAMHAQLQFLDFKNGNGMRFLTQLTQGITPINNYELFYTFQGLTSDGKYYISAILPVTNPELPTDSNISGDMANALNDYRTYLSNTITLLNERPSVVYTPDLDKLDALIRSIESK